MGTWGHRDIRDPLNVPNVGQGDIYRDMGSQGHVGPPGVPSRTTSLRTRGHRDMGTNLQTPQHPLHDVGHPWGQGDTGTSGILFVGKGDTDGDKGQS